MAEEKSLVYVCVHTHIHTALISFLTETIWQLPSENIFGNDQTKKLQSINLLYQIMESLCSDNIF